MRGAKALHLLEDVLVEADLVLVHDCVSAPSTHTALDMLRGRLLLFDLRFDKLLIVFEVVKATLLLLLLLPLLLFSLISHLTHVGEVGSSFLSGASLSLLDLITETLAHVSQALLESALACLIVLIV